MGYWDRFYGFKTPKTWVKGGYVKNDREMGGDEITGLDAINPAHYQRYRGLEVIDVTEQLNFCLGSATKYILRAGHKPGNSKVQDLEKAKWFIEREIRRIENEDNY